MVIKRKIRDIVYGFVGLDEQECEIIDHPHFQRLRRIRQLSMTDMVYPGATHTRFEHSIGVMQMASDMFDRIVDSSFDAMSKVYSLEKDSTYRIRKIIRLAALLHDVGHAPFSHAGEDLMPVLPKTHPRFVKGSVKKYTHEDYSIAVIKEHFKKIIEGHKLNYNHGIKTEDVTSLLGDKIVIEDMRAIILSLWKPLISSQLDADRADYLLRDSLHLGVNYGLYDRNRLINSLVLLILNLTHCSWPLKERVGILLRALSMLAIKCFRKCTFIK